MKTTHKYGLTLIVRDDLEHARVFNSSQPFHPFHVGDHMAPEGVKGDSLQVVRVEHFISLGGADDDAEIIDAIRVYLDTARPVLRSVP